MEQQLLNVGRTSMTLVYPLVISFDKDKCGVVKSSHLFQLLPTEGTCGDKKVDEVKKKWRDRISEGQDDGDILYTIGTYFTPITTYRTSLCLTFLSTVGKIIFSSTNTSFI